MIFFDASPTVEDLQHVRYLFTDIDDTLTTDGNLLPETYQALWDLNRAGIAIIPVTGGSAGWCEHIVRTWPVAAVIGESGAFVATRGRGRAVFEFWEDEAVQSRRQGKHLQLVESLLDPGLAISKDQRFRLADVAIDIAGVDRSAIDAMARRLRAAGAAVAISSIHINTWVGDYDKRSMCERWLRRTIGEGWPGLAEITAFVGDSRNDVPMFGYVRNSFGVGNILPILTELASKPRWITRRAAGLGFADVASTLLSARHEGRNHDSGDRSTAD